MNKAITDGLALMPPAFAVGLDQWSSEDGTPGSATWDTAGNGAFVSADQDFGGCLEILKQSSVTKLRWTGETPVLPGCYLRVKARVKAVSGNLPSARVAAWAGKSGGAAVTDIPLTGPSTALSNYGEIVEISAIIGTGNRTGVDMVWGTEPIYGHFGIDLTGADGGVVRIDDIEIEDITSAFHRVLMDWVDVRDFGAIGDGSTDDSAAFEAADTAAAGRQVLVPAGSFKLGENVTMESPVRFEGTVTMNAGKRLVLTRNFDLPTYAAAFGDEVEGFKRAFQALLNYSDHAELDMAGRRIQLTEPIDLAAAVNNVTDYTIRRVIRNGEINIIDGAAWDTDTVTSQASYSANDAFRLTSVANVANIEVGSLVTGNGVGREVYVTAKNNGAGWVELCQPLYGPAGTQNYTFTRFRYALDFSGFTSINRMTLDNIDFKLDGEASGVLLPPAGREIQFRDCYFTKPKDRGITSPGRSCQDLHVDRCQFISNEQSLPVGSRKTIAINVNANDAKIRDNRFSRFLHSVIANGAGHLFVGNHLFQGDDETDGTRVGSIILTLPNPKSAITGNYIDNSFIEMSNEHDANPDFSDEFSFGGLTISGNIFTANDVAAWFSWIVIKPYGNDHFIQGLNISGNVFRTLNGNIDRVDKVDSSFATLDFGRTRNLIMEGNTFNGIDQVVTNPVALEFVNSTPATTWTLDFGGSLPFGGYARNVTSVVIEGPLLDSTSAAVHHTPYVTVEHGSNADKIRLNFPEAVSGKAIVTTRVDNMT